MHKRNKQGKICEFLWESQAFELFLFVCCCCFVSFAFIFTLFLFVVVDILFSFAFIFTIFYFISVIQFELSTRTLDGRHFSFAHSVVVSAVNAAHLHFTQQPRHLLICCLPRMGQKINTPTRQPVNHTFQLPITHILRYLWYVLVCGECQSNCGWRILQTQVDRKFGNTCLWLKLKISFLCLTKKLKWRKQQKDMDFFLFLTKF